MRPLHPWLLAAFAYTAAPVAGAQHAPRTIVESNARATALIDAAIRAHGGPAALSAARRLQLRLEGRDLHRNQSRRVSAPYDATPYSIDYFADLPRERTVVQRTWQYPGGFHYVDRFVSDSARHWHVDVKNGTHTVRQFPTASAQSGNLTHTPLGLLLIAEEMAPKSHRRYLGRLRLTNGTEVDAVSLFFPNTTMTLGFDPATSLLRVVLGVGSDLLTGDASVETEFVDYRPLDGLLLPTFSRIVRSGELTRELRFVRAVVGAPIPDSLLTPPAGSAEVPTPAAREAVRTLAPGVWAVGNGGATGLLVELRDWLLVVDAGPNLVPEILRRAAELAPSKPIRYVVPTHHHDDHFAGVRGYAAAGATTVTTRGNESYFRRIVSLPRSPLMNSATAVPTPDAQVEFIEGKRRSFTDGVRTVEIHDIGPNEHAEEMLVAWIPAEGILFQADLIEAPRGIAQRGNNAEATQQLGAFIRGQGWRVRTFAGAHGFLDDAREFDALLELPTPR